LSSATGRDLDQRLRAVEGKLKEFARVLYEEGEEVRQIRESLSLAH
jgi:hypothetical protein